MSRLGLALLFALVAWSAHAGMPAAVSQKPPAGDEANAVVSGTLTANTACGTGTQAAPPAANAGCSGWFLIWGEFNVAIYGSGGPNGNWNATVEVDRSFDGGTTWVVVGVGGAGQQAIYNTPNTDVSVRAIEPEKGMLYRIRCTAYTSGTINYRISATGGAVTTWAPGSQ